MLQWIDTAYRYELHDFAERQRARPESVGLFTFRRASVGPYGTVRVKVGARCRALGLPDYCTLLQFHRKSGLDHRTSDPPAQQIYHHQLHHRSPQ